MADGPPPFIATTILTPGVASAGLDAPSKKATQVCKSQESCSK
jgi:hypothetical protein